MSVAAQQLKTKGDFSMWRNWQLANANKKRTPMSKLCILELAGDFSSESIFRKVYDFHKISKKEVNFLEIFFVLRSAQYFFHFLWAALVPESVTVLSSTRNCFSFCKHHLLCNLGEMDYLIKKNPAFRLFFCKINIKYGSITVLSRSGNIQNTFTLSNNKGYSREKELDFFWKTSLPVLPKFWLILTG